MPSSPTIPFNLRVFISSTFSDLEKYRQAAFEAIQSLGAHGDDMIQWSADERAGAQHSVDRVRQCDVVILLLAHRYGFVDTGSQLGVTELEYRAAREARIPVLAYFLDESQPWPPDQIEWEKIDQIKAFKRRVEAEVTRKLFRSTDELGRLVTQALALFMERHRNRLAGSKRFVGLALRVDASIALRIQPDTTVRIGNTEDGIPLILRVRRSRDLSRHMEALAAEMPGSSNSAMALISSFRQSLEAHAKDAWALDRLESVRWSEESMRQLYVTSSNLSQLFRSTLALMLANASGRVKHSRSSGISVIRAQTVAQTVIEENSNKVAALESEGGKNRFLGIDPLNGEVFSVGRRASGWVQWRPFVFESIEALLPAAKFFLGPHDNTRDLLTELPKALMDLANRSRSADGVLDTKVTVCIPRQQIVLLLAEVTKRVGEMHARGIVHGDLKPHNILLGSQGPELIDAFNISEGEVSPGWTPNWSAPEQILGEPVSAVCDIYPIGKMIADVLGGELVGEVRTFMARPIDRDLTPFHIFYNPSVYFHPNAAAASGKSLATWVALVRHCLRFTPTERPRSAIELEQRIRDIAGAHPLHGEVRISLPGELRVATLPDGSQSVARLIGDTEGTEGSWVDSAAPDTADTTSWCLP